jgi:hypothetical protein
LHLIALSLKRVAVGLVAFLALGLVAMFMMGDSQRQPHLSLQVTNHSANEQAVYFDNLDGHDLRLFGFVKGGEISVFSNLNYGVVYSYIIAIRATGPRGVNPETISENGLTRSQRVSVSEDMLRQLLDERIRVRISPDERLTLVQERHQHH